MCACHVSLFSWLFVSFYVCWSLAVYFPHFSCMLVVLVTFHVCSSLFIFVSHVSHFYFSCMLITFHIRLSLFLFVGHFLCMLVSIRVCWCIFIYVGLFSCILVTFYVCWFLLTWCFTQEESGEDFGLFYKKRPIYGTNKRGLPLSLFIFVGHFSCVLVSFDMVFHAGVVRWRFCGDFAGGTATRIAAVCCSVLKCVAVCCGVLQYVAVCCGVL